MVVHHVTNRNHLHDRLRNLAYHKILKNREILKNCEILKNRHVPQNSKASVWTRSMGHEKWPRPGRGQFPKDRKPNRQFQLVLMSRVVLGVIGFFLFYAQNMPNTSSIHHPNAHSDWTTWLRRRPFLMIFFGQIFRFLNFFFCFEVLQVAHLYSIIPLHLSNISRVWGFCGTLWKKSCDRLKIISFWKN